MDPKDAYLSKPWVKYYPEGVPQEVEVPETSVHELFDQMAETVALYLLNCPQYVIAYFAILKVGAKVTPIGPVYTSKEVKHQLEDSEARTVICEDILYDNVEKAGAELDNVILSNIGDYLPSLKRMFGKSALAKAYRGMEVPTPQVIEEAGLHLFQNLIKKYPPQPPQITIEPKNDIAALPYTGGTTGLPKAAILTHYNIVSLQAQTYAFWPIFEEGKEVAIAFLPFFHIYGQVVVMLSGLVQGSTLVLFTTPDIDEILSAMERYQASGFFGVPSLYEYLKDYEKTDRVNWKRLKLIACGADTLHESTINEWERRTGSKILEGYGMTETTAVSHSTPFNRPKSGSFGVPLPSVIAAIVAVEGTEFVPVGEVGELILHGPNMMQGYWKRPKETEESIIEIDGKKWLRTGDLVRMDEEGYFHFFDRKRDLIKYKGHSVFARHVEEVLYKHPQIKAAGVVGVPDRAVGHFIKAFVVLQTEARGKISEEEIMAFCRENLAHYKVPKVIEFRGELPKTDVGKVSRRELREEAEEG
jgi:long-chain acyl-CoA synthetase